MESERKHFKIGDLFELTHGFAFKSKDFVSSGVPVIKIKNVKANSVVLNNLAYVDESFLKKRRDKIIKRGDILITMSGNRFGSTRKTWVGKVAQFTIPGSYLLNQRVGILRPKPGITLNSRFCTYILSSNEYQELFISIATSSGGQANISPLQILGTDILLPPLHEQHAIANILGALDDKIESNRKMNNSLEAIARAIFRSWFMDFDPVRAKAEGRQPVGIDHETAVLFPDSFEDSELGQIPKEWKVKSIGEAVRCVGGSTPSTKISEYWEDGTNPFVTPKDMSTLTSPVIMDTTRHITESGVNTISSGQLPIGTVLLSSRAPIGYLAIAEAPVSVNQGIIAMICDKELPNYYVLYWTEANMETIKSNAGGTTFAEISKRNFRPIKLVIPPSQLLKKYNKQCELLFRRIVANLQESKNLASIRDVLLPKLFSGDIQIKDAGKFVEMSHE